MQDLFKEFPKVSEQEWIAQIEKDLKGKSIEDTLQFEDTIEEISFRAFSYSHENHPLQPGELPYTRSAKLENNDWEIITNVSTDNASTTNKKALNALMKGATGLTIDLGQFSSEECNQAVKGIEFDYIVANFLYHTKEQRDWLEQLITSHASFKGTCFSTDTSLALLPTCRNKRIDASIVQKSGGNTTQEIAYALHMGHLTLVKLMKSGMSCDDASAQLQFNFGVGNNYFFEIIKFRVFRSLWSKIVTAYQPEHRCSSAAYISAETGLLNKSLSDPNTNLLRQTTEAMSAVIGGVNELTVVPYDARSTNPTEKSERLATNISLLLKEESYFDKVIDPIGGAYSLETLSTFVEDKAWKLFLTLEKEGVKTINESIEKTKTIRTELIKDKKLTLIGVNKYFNPDTVTQNWLPATTFSVGTELIVERDCKFND